MCGRYTLTMTPQQVLKQFATLNTVDLVPRYNIAPTQPVAAIWEESGNRQMHLARWGLVPRWVKDPRQFSLLVNARAETMAEKPAFRDSLKHGRCILPATGYYEWQTVPGGRKQPYYITFADDAPMALAGLYTIWTGPNGEEVDTVATITVPANEQLSQIHDRMPVILRGAEIEQWLNVRDVRANTALQLALPLEDGALKFRPVSIRVNSARDDDPALIEPVTPEKLEPPAAPRPRKRAGDTGQMDLF